MARDTVFDYLGELLEKMPDEVNNAVIESTIEAVDEYGNRMFDFLAQHGGKSLSKHIYKKDNKESFENQKTNTYIFYADWSDKLVNPNRKTINDTHTNYNPKKSRGKYFKGRTQEGKETRKRNYSKVPATWHDLAYILATGRTIVKNDGSVTIIPPKHFLSQGVRRKKGWKPKQIKLFAKKLENLAKELK